MGLKAVCIEIGTEGLREHLRQSNTQLSLLFLLKKRVCTSLVDCINANKAAISQINWVQTPSNVQYIHPRMQAILPSNNSSTPLSHLFSPSLSFLHWLNFGRAFILQEVQTIDFLSKSERKNRFLDFLENGNSVFHSTFIKDQGVNSHMFY